MTHKLYIFGEWIEFDADYSDTVQELEKKIMTSYKNKTGIDLTLMNGCITRTNHNNIECKVTFSEVD